MSDNMEEVLFKLRLNSSWFRLPPHVKIWINDELIEDLEVTEKKDDREDRFVEFSRRLPDGEHQLVIQYLDKEMPDTRVDENGNILEDTLLNIDEIEIDEIELGYLAYEKSVFYPDRTNRPDLPESMTQIKNLGYNGRWTIKFEVPTYIWFLENL